MSYELITRHEQLLHFLSQFRAYKTSDGRPVFKVRDRFEPGGPVEGISFLQVNRAADLLCDLFNLTAEAMGEDFDLYKLLQGYVLDAGTREKINKLL